MTDRADYLEDVTNETPHAAAPVDVRVVESVRVQDFPARSWQPTQTTVTGASVQQLAGEHHARTHLLVRNTGAQVVYLAPQLTTATPSSGFPLAAGQQLTLDTTAAVYAVCALDVDGITPLSSTVATLAQFKDG